MVVVILLITKTILLGNVKYLHTIIETYVSHLNKKKHFISTYGSRLNIDNSAN